MKKLLILCPLYNDWKSYIHLLKNIETVFAENNEYSIRFLCVDDASEENSRGNFFNNQISNVSLLNVNRNVGHQKAIAIGLSYAHNNLDYDYLTIMDSDGEDNPNDLLRMLDHVGDNCIVFAKRIKREERFIFKVFYRLFKYFFFILTGKRISFGNYSILGSQAINKIVNDCDLWVNYSSCTLNHKITRILVNTNRSKRYFGQSKMNFQSLILHGLGAFSIHIEKIAARLLIFTIFMGVLASFGIAFTVYVKIFTDTAIPGWATSFISSLAIILFQSITMCLLLTFIILNRKTQRVSIPRIDYINYIKND